MEILLNWLNTSLSLSLWKLLAVVIASMMVSSTLTHLADIAISIPSVQASVPLICPAPITCPKLYPRAHWERRWKDTPNNDGKGY